jgi:DedD protein
VESSTKERLTGALILIAALVVLVPEMLSGPGRRAGAIAPAQDPQAGAPMRTYDMPLDPAAAGSDKRQQGLTPTPGEEAAAVPPPVTQSAPPAPPVAEAASAVAQAATEEGKAPAGDAAPRTGAAPAAAEAAKPSAAAEAKPASPEASKPATPETTPVAAGGKWWVQAGVFASADNAQRLARDLKAAGIPTVVSQITAQGKQMHRVRSGPVADRAAALALQAKLAAKGHKSTLVGP